MWKNIFVIFQNFFAVVLTKSHARGGKFIVTR